MTPVTEEVRVHVRSQAWRQFINQFDGNQVYYQISERVRDQVRIQVGDQGRDQIHEQVCEQNDV